MRQHIVALVILVATGWLAADDTAVAQDGRRLPQKAPDAAFHARSQEFSLREFEGRKVMLWLLSTWCSSCIAGLDALADAQPRLARANLKILALRNHENGGFPGPTITEFAQRPGDAVTEAPNWVFGQASAGMAQRYNPRKYPDIYYLIDEEGMVRAVSTAPAATLDKIERFATGR